MDQARRVLTSVEDVGGHVDGAVGEIDFLVLEARILDKVHGGEAGEVGVQQLCIVVSDLQPHHIHPHKSTFPSIYEMGWRENNVGTLSPR